MTTYANFMSGPGWSQSPQHLPAMVALGNVWPEGLGSETGGGDKDVLADGDHPVLAIGGQTTADGRPYNLTGVVVTYESNAELVVMNVALGAIVKAYVANVLTYSGGDADTFETAPVIGQPVYVDDSDDLGAGCTLSLSPLNDGDVANPMAGYLWYCQTEYKDGGVGGPNVDAVWPLSWDESYGEFEVCVFLTPAVHYAA